MFKNILVPVDGSEYGFSQVSHALDIAAIYHSKVTLLHVVDIKIVEGPLLRDMTFLSEAVTDFEYHSEIKNSLEEKGRLILQKLAAECEKAGVAFETKLLPGIVPNTIAENAKTADLVIMGKRGENANFGSAFLGSVVENATRLVNKPVMVVDEKYRKLQKVLFAYDGTASANKALQLLAQFTLAAKYDLCVITVADDEIDGKAVLDEAVSYLESYDIRPEQILKSGDVVNTIIETADQAGHDVIMMGAYGHSAIHQMLLGSTTTLLVRAAKVPVILYR
ncbi:MAG TPA: universal stress protein [Candidatus Wallbacteria bacterium]|nr:MAG: Universal stress protein [bacterium ADurb.Bin243]HPG57291.1 universal stress protein [Candidatus Wallbacteria bacterium]